MDIIQSITQEMRDIKIEVVAVAQSLPHEIIYEILIRLPAKSLIKCTSVCKTWRSMIINPTFIRTHLTRKDLLLLYCVPGARRSRYSRRIREPMEELCSLHYDNHAFDKYCKVQFPIVPSEELHNSFLRVVGTCNGLVCLADDILHLGYTIIVCNPSIRKSVTLPKPHLTDKMCDPYYACIGFGFDALTNDYKVVRLVTHQWDNPSSFEVYSLSTDSWSKPSSFSPVCEVKDRSPQAFVDGALHWVAICVKEDASHSSILAFDLSSELFREIMMPKSFKRDESFIMQLSASGDGKSLSLFTMSYSHAFIDIWVMKEYGMEESWTELITLGTQDPLESLPSKALCVRKTGEVVLELTDNYYNDRRGLVSLDLVTKQSKNLGFHEYQYYYVDSYEESLVLLDKMNVASY